jgi:cytoskeletal protein CcmA (bactofilin family)
MFSSRSKAPSPDQTPAPLAPAAAAKRNRPHSAPTIVSADMVISGTLASGGDVQIDGQVEGDVRCTGLVIGDKAEVQGEIYAEDVTIRGKVIGRIRARRVTLAATSHVEGDILHEAFSVEAGAFFEGNCRHSDNPLGDVDGSSRRSQVTNGAPAALFASLSPATT